MKAYHLLIFLIPAATAIPQELPSSLKFESGPVNAISIAVGAKRIAINRSIEPNPDLLLLTHARRDIVQYARDSKAAELRAPRDSEPFLKDVSEKWNTWWEERFDYYVQQVTRLPLHEVPISQYLEEGATLAWGDLEIKMLATPGYTRDGATYLISLEEKKIAFTGDLILEGGKVPDLYSFQEAIPEAKVGGYHGYLGRLAVWLDSLDKLAAEKPDLIIPSRGSLIENPDVTIRSAQERARQIYGNYLSTNALHWYFGEERMNICAARVLGPGQTAEGMPFAEHVDLPEWCQHIGTTKLLVSGSGRGFALDVGGKRSLDTLRTALIDGLITGLDGIFATHTHNDHTAAIAEAAREFGCPVYATPEVADVLENPGNWFLPGVSPNAVETVTVKEDGEQMEWEEFKVTFHFFPGQMYNHGALLVQKPDHEPVLFMGDSFSPSGIDDYCLMNRNLMGEGTGYELCFQKIGSLPENLWMVNQHIPHLFRFSNDEKNFLLTNYRKRRQLISEFTPWDHPDYAVDPQWASFYPYGQTASRGETVSCEVRIHNHSSVGHTYEVRTSTEWLDSAVLQQIEIPARSLGVLPLSLAVPESIAPGVHVATADIEREDGVIARAFCETLIKVE